MMSDYLSLCFYCIVQFGLKKNITKERDCFREHVAMWEKNRKKHKQQQTQANKNKSLLDVITFQIVLY